MEALARWLYVLWGLWGITTAAAKVVLTQADGICFNTLRVFVMVQEALLQGFSLTLFCTAAPSLIAHLHGKLHSSGAKVFICIDYRWNLLISWLSLHCFCDCIQTHLITRATFPGVTQWCWIVYASEKTSGCCPPNFCGSSKIWPSFVFFALQNILIKKQSSVHFLVWSSVYSCLPLRQAQGQNAF